MSEQIDVISETTDPVAEVIVVTPEQPKPSPAIAAKPKKSRTSTKASHGFSKRDTKSQIQELKIISDVIETSHQIEELKPEQSPEPVAEVIVKPVEQIADEILQVAEETVVETNIDLSTSEIAEVIPEIALDESLAEPIISEPIISEPIISEIPAEEITVSTPESSSTPKSLAKSKKSKATNKSGHGFNKSKGDR